MRHPRALLATTAVCAAALTLGATPAAAQPLPASSASVSVSASLFVSPSGSDSAAGTAAAPLKTLTAAVAKAPVGATIVMATGSYHESIAMYKDGLTIKAADGAEVWLDGSRRVNDWTRSGSTWVADGWTAEFDHSPTYTVGAPDSTRETWQFVNPARPMAAHPDQVWVDDAPLRQVGSRSQVGSGTFFVDYAADQLIIGSDPTGRTVRSSDLGKALSIRGANVSLDGVNVRRYAPSVPTMGAVTAERPGITFSNLEIRENATTGLRVISPGAQLRNVGLVNNGLLGMGGYRADGLDLRNLRVVGNNTEGFNPSPAAGGLKVTRTNGITIRSSAFERNAGNGLWFDESAFRMKVLDSTFMRNVGHGMSLEISGRATVADNVIAHNGGNGIKINDTDRVRVWNNTFVGNTRPINVVQDYRDVDLGGSYRDWALPLTLRNESIAIRNNIISEPASGSTCLVCVEDYSHRFSAEELKITARGNLYHLGDGTRPRWVSVWSRGESSPAVFTDVASFRAATGQESRGSQIDGGTVMNEAFLTTAAVQETTLSTAVRVPKGLARLTGHGRARHLGAWLQ